MRSKGRLKRYHSKGRNLDGQADRSKEEEAPLFLIYNKNIMVSKKEKIITRALATILLLAMMLVLVFEANSQTKDQQQILYQLNAIRKNPSYFVPKSYGKYKPVNQLEWCDTLHEIAYAHAKEMAKNKKVYHYTQGYNESVGSFHSAKLILYDFIHEIDSNSKSGHRDHLLSKNNNDTKIGIGILYARDGVYVCIKTN